MRTIIIIDLLIYLYVTMAHFLSLSVQKRVFLYTGVELDSLVRMYSSYAFHPFSFSRQEIGIAPECGLLFFNSFLVARAHFH